MTVFRTLIYRCCSAIAFLSGIAALTIMAAIAANKLSDDPEAWVAAVFFIVASGAALLVAAATR
jgi:hypothetical protein